jgi:hypothetical protein
MIYSVYNQTIFITQLYNTKQPGFTVSPRVIAGTCASYLRSVWTAQIFYNKL